MIISVVGGTNCLYPQQLNSALWISLSLSLSVSASYFQFCVLQGKLLVTQETSVGTGIIHFWTYQNGPSMWGFFFGMPSRYRPALGTLLKLSYQSNTVIAVCIGWFFTFMKNLRFQFWLHTPHVNGAWNLVPLLVF